MNTPTDSPRTEDLDKQLLTEKEACAYLRVSKLNLHCWRMAGLIPYFKIGRAVRFKNPNSMPLSTPCGLVELGLQPNPYSSGPVKSLSFGIFCGQIKAEIHGRVDQLKSHIGDTQQVEAGKFT